MKAAKHAYLIIAHNNFGVLQCLISALDDARNDIYIHFDARVKQLPHLKCFKSHLFIIPNRIKVHWGHISQVKVEFLLFEAALNNNDDSYEYVHLISGTHFPLKSQDYLHNYFSNIGNKSIVSKIYWGYEDILFRMGLQHFFLPNAVSGTNISSHIRNFLWRGLLKVQPISKNKVKELFKGKYSQWVSLYNTDLIKIYDFKKEILHKFNHTFCSDEHVMPYLFDRIGIKPIESSDYLFQNFPKASPERLNMNKLNEIINSGCLFARKFDDEDLLVLDKIQQTYNK